MNLPQTHFTETMEIALNTYEKLNESLMKLAVKTKNAELLEQYKKNEDQICEGYRLLILSKKGRV